MSEPTDAQIEEVEDARLNGLIEEYEEAKGDPSLTAALSGLGTLYTRDCDHVSRHTASCYTTRIDPAELVRAVAALDGAKTVEAVPRPYWRGEAHHIKVDKPGTYLVVRIEGEET